MTQVQTRPSPKYQVLGTGYTALESVAVTSDGRTAYVTERTGDLLRVDLSNANQAAAIPVSTGMDAPHQIVLDEASGNAYIVEFADPGGLIRIDLSNGNRTQLVANLPYAIGLLLSADRNTAYVSQQLSNGSGQLSSINLSTGSRQLLASSSGNPFFMLAWATADRTGIFVPERAPASKLWLLDMTAQPANLRLVSGMPDATSVVVLAHGAAFPIAVCNAPEVDKLSSS